MEGTIDPRGWVRTGVAARRSLPRNGVCFERMPGDQDEARAVHVSLVPLTAAGTAGGT